MEAVSKIFRWLLAKMALAGLVLALGFVACGAWLAVHDGVDFDAARHDALRNLVAQRRAAQVGLAGVRARLRAMSVEISAEHERIRQTDKILAELASLETTWNRLTGDAQQRENRERQATLRERQAQSAGHLASLQTEFSRATWERDGLEIALAKFDRALLTTESRRSAISHYLHQIWSHPLGPMPVKFWVLFGVGLYMLGPIAWSLALYFVVAPLVARGRPIRLVDKLNELPGVGTAHGSVDVTLQAKERMLVRERFLDAVTDGLKRRTRFLLDWRWPFTWSASGLAKLVELKNPHPLREYGCTLTDRSNPHGELTVVTLRSGVRMVVRPSFIAAVVLGEGERLRVRRRWQLFRWQPWIARQFRFLEFQGPCRLVIAGHRGVRAEWLMDRGGRPNPARRATHDAAIGFTPNLNYQPIRAETFWSYHQGMNPLFDELFSGHGLFLCQGLPGEGSVRPARRFWSKARTGALKVFGL